MRQIDADELRRRIIAFSTGSNTTYLTVENIVMMINKADTVDAVPVVRCKDCKYYKPEVQWTREQVRRRLRGVNGRK